VTSEGAQRVLVVTRTDLDLRQANDLEDTLSIDPAVTVGGSTAIAQKIYVRNLGEGLINVSVDGATQSGSLFHHIGRNTLEPELLQQVEIQPGTGNAADGPGALGGAIRFVTKDPADLLRPGESGGALVKQSYFSNTDGSKTSVTGFGRANDTWSGLLSLVYADYGEIEDGEGNSLDGSDSQQQVAFGKVVGSFKNGQTVRFSYENLQEEGNKLRRPEWAPGPANPSFYMEVERNTGTFGYGIRPETMEWLDLQFTASYTEADLLQVGVFGPYRGTIEGLQFDLRNTQRIGAHTLVYGIDHRRDEVNAGPSSAPQTYGEDGSVTGLFTQNAFAVTDRLTVNAGTRFDTYRLHDRLDQDFKHEGFSPNLGAAYQVTKAFSLNANVATAYRGPDINDAFRVDIASNDPDLEAEKAVNYELRALYQKAGLQLETGGYINRIDDVITNTLPWSNVYTNAGELETEGFFARASYTLGDVTAGLQFNHADTTLDGQTATRYQYSSLVSSIGDTWVLDLVWRPVDQLDLGWNMRLVQGIDDIEVPFAITGVAGSTIDKPGYTTHDVFLRWRPAFTKALTVNLTVKNIFDKQYLSHGSVEDLTAFPGFAAVHGAPEPGRDIRVSVTLRF
jgi:hemoglobin/transferrin/lactoferrin receptor protein